MSAPQSAQSLPMQLGNASGPLASVQAIVPIEGQLMDSLGKPVTGTLKLRLQAYISQQWRYLMGQFAQKSPSISRSFSLKADVGYSQAQMQALADQVALLSQQVGGSS